MYLHQYITIVYYNNMIFSLQYAVCTHFVRNSFEIHLYKTIKVTSNSGNNNYDYNNNRYTCNYVYTVHIAVWYKICIYKLQV